MACMKGKINISREFCKGCELCMFFCPQKIISLSSELNSNGYLTAVCTNSEGCTGCAVCATVCPEAAIEVYRG
jgi:2-oxoglutarate ferredoxin oxidoreductase subunit delta